MSEARRPRNLNGLASRLVKSFRIRQALREIALSRSLLDLGCGLCELTGKIPASVAYTGVERDRWLYERAVERFPERRFLQADIEDNSFNPGVITDSIVLLAVWEHLRDPMRLLGRARGWVQPGGRFIMTTPSPAAHRLLEFGAALGLLSRHADEEHERLWSIDEVETRASEAGWRVVAARRFLFGLNQLIVLEACAPGMASGRPGWT